MKKYIPTEVLVSHFREFVLLGDENIWHHIWEFGSDNTNSRRYKKIKMLFFSFSSMLKTAVSKRYWALILFFIMDLNS